MRFITSLALLASAATVAVAADACAAQNIVTACVDGYQDRIKGCNAKSNDWICLCDVYSDVLTCYNNCPDSEDKPPVQNQVTQFCEAAKPLRAASSSAAAAAASTAGTTQAPTTTAAPTGSAASTSASAAPFSTGVAGIVAAPAGGALVALMGLAGLL